MSSTLSLRRQLQSRQTFLQFCLTTAQAPLPSCRARMGPVLLVLLVRCLERLLRRQWKRCASASNRKLCWLPVQVRGQIKHFTTSMHNSHAVLSVTFSFYNLKQKDLLCRRIYLKCNLHVTVIYKGMAEMHYSLFQELLQTCCLPRCAVTRTSPMASTDSTPPERQSWTSSRICQFEKYSIHCPD